ncbi:porin [Chromobacterium violaceum]|uniref:porin n=1 Tax=Chromobacterium violaceum TaxID=536 RepID=UPI001BEC56D0|nr:porin [Chromobacterium violaceum]MBT2867215.1 porin [Chromobacterium violaceum]
MKKSLIALLVATLPAAAFADVTIYGKIKGGVEYVDNGSTKQTNVDDLGSRIGFKGSEDLGNGLKTIWQVETGFGIDGTSSKPSDSGTFANRESFIGLQGGFGTVRLGNVSNFLDSDMGTVDTWEYKSDALGLSIFTRDATRLKNSVRYDLPTVVPGLTAALQYGVKENKAANTSDRETTVLGLGYENSGFFGKYAYTHESKASTGFSYKANDKHRLEVGYNANNLFVGLGYQQEKGGFDVVGWNNYVASSFTNVSIKPTDDVKTQEVALTAGYTFGAITPKFTYAHANNVKVNGVSISNTKYDQYVLGADYAISKRTTFGAQYGQIAVKGDGNKDLKAFGLNMVHKF